MRQNTHLPTRPARDAGVALIIALAVLALLLVLLIAFLSSSILEHRIAFNQSSQVAARLAVRSAMTRAQFQLKNYGDDLAWFRTEDYGPKTANPNVIAPLVSGNGVLSDSKTEPDEASCAMSALTPLLGHYLTVKNYFPKIDSSSDKTDYYPQWIDLTANGRLTGRYAYVVLPNLGIAPAVMGSGSTERVGGADFKELPLTGLGFRAPLSGLGFLESAGITRVTSLDQWLSFELMTGGKGIYNDEAFYNTAALVKNEFYTNSVTRRELANLYFTPDVWKFAEKRPDSSWRAHKGDPRINLKGKQFTSSDLGTLTDTDTNGLFADFGDVKNQVAANLIDYTDSDSIPTSDVPAADWKSSASHPAYTGNECTPYINQVVPMVQVNAAYSVQTAAPVDPETETRYSVTRMVNVSFRGDLLVELINIYPKNFSKEGTEFTVFIKGLKITGKVTLDEDANGKGTLMTHLVKDSDAGAAFTLEGDFTTQAVTTIGGRAYATVRIPLTNSIRTPQALGSPYYSSAPQLVPEENLTSYLADLPRWYVKATVDSVQFNRAVLTWRDGTGEPETNVDYVKGTTKTPSSTWLLFNQNNDNSFRNASGEMFGSAYLSYEAIDPRCNLLCSDGKCWDFQYSYTQGEALSDDNVPNRMDRNKNADAKNTTPTEEKDLEPNNDPKELSTAYIRNAAMLSPWELALIHRGTPWQTVNLRSALHPMADGYDSKSYLNDAILLEKIKFSGYNEACKFNIDLPAQHESAFGVLTKGLAYHDPENHLVATGGALAVTGTGTVTLTDAAAQELAKWIANKCYNAGGTDPAADSAKRYQRYLHRGMLANVIMDWARNGSDSPFKDKDLKEAHLSELVGKIVPLTRCGDTYEYFTVFAVGQAIKDFGGGKKVFYKYNADGELITTGSDDGKNTAEFGTFDDGIDQITAQTYLVARIRREVTHCEGKDCCKLGIHDPGCTFKLTVLESYTLDEL